MSLQLGLEVCIAEPPALLRGRRFGLLMNQASVDCHFRAADQCLAEAFPGQLAALFGPQHGLSSEQQDNMIETPHGHDAALDAPIYSLYAERRKPTPQMLEGLELLVVDLQDVGTRVYTYIWTLSYCLEACAEAGVPVLILDRPNPLGGEICEGPLLSPACTSFVGRASIPMRHGLTIGEMAGYLNQAMAIGAEIEVVAMRGWQRRMLWSDTGRAWVPTSPNLPRLEGVLLYPGQVLLEGCNLSEGRGTTTPFEVVGAPFIDPQRLCDRLATTPGCVARPYRFEPTFQKHAGQSCGGVFLHPTDPAQLRSYLLTVELLAAVRELWPEQFAWNDPPYEYEAEIMPIDILSGDHRLREAIDAGVGSAGLAEVVALDTEDWSSRCAAFRRYS